MLSDYDVCDTASHGVTAWGLNESYREKAYKNPPRLPRLVHMQLEVHSPGGRDRKAFEIG